MAIVKIDPVELEAKDDIKTRLFVDGIDIDSTRPYASKRINTDGSETRMFWDSAGLSRDNLPMFDLNTETSGFKALEEMARKLAAHSELGHFRV